MDKSHKQIHGMQQRTWRKLVALNRHIEKYSSPISVTCDSLKTLEKEEIKVGKCVWEGVSHPELK